MLLAQSFCQQEDFRIWCKASLKREGVHRHPELMRAPEGAVASTCQSLAVCYQDSYKSRSSHLAGKTDLPSPKFL